MSTPSRTIHSESPAGEHVVLLHGLARSARSMSELERFFTGHGYKVWNIGYPSRKHPIERLGALVREQVVAKTAGANTVHFVTHSLGGCIIRWIQKECPIPNLGRVVMLSPPNQGSEVVDKLGGFALFRWINGPAGRQLGTGARAVSGRLGPVNFPLGVITGDRSINWINSLIIPGKDDGKVSVERAKVEGMKDFTVVHAVHPFIMNNRKVMELCHRFIKYGEFKEKQPL